MSNLPLEKLTSLLTKQARYISNKETKIFLTENVNYVAFTDGEEIFINIKNPLAKELSTDEELYEHLVGLNAHEAGHLVFTDFDFLINILKNLENNIFYPNEPVFLETVDKLYLDKILKDSLLPYIAPFIKDIGNIIEDKWMENKIMLMFPGTKRAVLKNELLLFKLSPTYEELKNNNTPDLSIFISLLLQYVRTGVMKCEDKDTLSVMGKITPLADIAVKSDDVTIRYDCIYKMLIKLYPYIKKEFDKDKLKNSLEKIQEETKQNSHDEHQSSRQNKANSQNSNAQSSNNDSGVKSNNNNSTCNQADSQNERPNNSNKSINKNSNKKCGRNAKNSSTAGTKELENLIKEIKDAANEIKKGSSVSEVVEKISDKTDEIETIKEIIKEVVESKSYNKQQKEFEKSLKEMKEQKEKQRERQNQKNTQKEQQIIKNRTMEIKKINSDFEKFNKNYPVNYIRKTNTGSYYYDSVKSEIKKHSNNLAKRFNIKDENTKENNLLMGNRLNINRLYCREGRVFSKNTIENEFDMSVIILVDTSRSMCGDRIYEAKKTASILYDFCKTAGIPVSVYGHSESGEVEIEAVAEFDSVDGKDKYRIMNLQSGGCNRDGFVLRIMGKFLEKRPEQRKALIIISDGKPNGSGYRGEEAVDDTQKAVLELKKKGISIIAAAIGDDRECLAKIYGNAFLNINNLSTMPQKFTELLLH